MIWSLPENSAIAVGTSDRPMSESFTYSVPPANIETSNLEIIASLTDKDPAGNNNEFLGTRTITVALSNIEGSVEYQMVFDNHSNHAVQLTYTITRE
jgi:hypothetical protein